MNIRRKQRELEKEYLRRIGFGHVSPDALNIGIASEALKGIIELRDKYKKLSDSNDWYHPEDTMLWNNVYCDLDKLVNKIEGYNK